VHLKTIFKTLIIFIFCFLSTLLLAGNKTVTPDKEAKARQWLNHQPLAFIENKGQFATTEGKPADNVLFKTTYGNCDIYITTEGLSYVFVKMEDGRKKKEDGRRKTEEERKKLEEDKHRKDKFGDREKEENRKVSYYRLDMKLEGATIDKANIIKEQAGKQGHYNYFYAHCPEGIYDVQEYGKITIKNIYKGIDWVIYTNADSKGHPLKYDFVVHPQANYKDIKLKFINAQSTNLTENDTKLQIKTIAGTIEEGNLYAYIAPLCHAERSEASHTKIPSEAKHTAVKSNYILNDSIIQFEIANYDTTQTLIIDPLVWATYYGGNGSYDIFNSICTDNQDNIYITGWTSSTNFPVQQLIGAYWQANYIDVWDVFLLKFNSQGQRLWATYYGGEGAEYATSICVDSQNNIYIVGETGSDNFPTQYLSGSYNQDTIVFTSGLYRTDGFILKFNYLGQRLWATYYGGRDDERGLAICTDSQDNIYIIFNTHSNNLPVQQLTGAYWHTASLNYWWGLFILKFNSQGQRLWATYYGDNNFGNFMSIGADSQDNIYIGLNDSLLKFNSQSVLLWVTYYGGTATSICADSQDNIYIVGSTGTGTNFPTLQLAGAYWQATNAGSNDIFIVKFNSQGTKQWATYYGGSQSDFVFNNNGADSHFSPIICADNYDNIYITGSTYSFDFPLQPLAETYNQATISGIQGYHDAFILKFNSQGQRQWATYYGTSGRDAGKGIAVDSQNSVYFIGEAEKGDAYTVDYGNGAYYDSTLNGGTDGFILKFMICNVEMPTTAQSNRNNFCANDNGNITITATGGSGNSLKWYTGGCGQTFIGNGTSLTIPSPAQTTTYYARRESCDTSFSPCASVTVTVDTSTTAAPSIAQSSKNNFCVNDNGSITLTAIGGRGNTLKWFTGSCGQTYIGIDTLTIPSPVQTTTYYARWENQCDTSACASVTVNVKPLPVVNLGKDAVICEGEIVQLITDSIYTSYLWQDGSTNSSYVLSEPGVYWLTVNYNNCFNSDTIIYTLCEPPLNIWIPNAFTPNGDGKNDAFNIESINKIKDFHLYIYNRWGQVIFETNDINKGWDGTFKGKDIQEGVYIWKLEYQWDGNYNESSDGEKHGTITLLR